MLKNLSLKDVGSVVALWVLKGNGPPIMKEENKKLIKVFLGKSASLKEGIFADNKKMPDFAPFIIDIMRDR